MTLGSATSGELTTLSANNISSINLNSKNTNQNINDNLIWQTSSFTKNDGSSSLIADVKFSVNTTNSSFYSYTDENGNLIDYNLNLKTLSLPLSRGYGSVLALPIAMSKDSHLLSQMQELVNNPNLSLLDSNIESFIYSWAGVAGVSGMRGSFDAKKLAAIEAFRGSEFTSSTGSHDVGAWQVTKNNF